MPSLVHKEDTVVEVKHELFLTMIDGKVAQVLTETSSSSVCTICGAKPREMNDLSKVSAKPENEDAFQYGLCTLHAWIRFMETVLHISYNLSFKKWSATIPENKIKKKRRRKMCKVDSEMSLVFILTNLDKELVTVMTEILPEDSFPTISVQQILLELMKN